MSTPVASLSHDQQHTNEPTSIHQIGETNGRTYVVLSSKNLRNGHSEVAPLPGQGLNNTNPKNAETVETTNSLLNNIWNPTNQSSVPTTLNKRQLEAEEPSRPKAPVNQPGGDAVTNPKGSLATKASSQPELNNPVTEGTTLPQQKSPDVEISFEKIIPDLQPGAEETEEVEFDMEAVGFKEDLLPFSSTDEQQLVEDRGNLDLLNSPEVQEILKTHPDTQVAEDLSQLNEKMKGYYKTWANKCTVEHRPSGDMYIFGNDDDRSDLLGHLEQFLSQAQCVDLRQAQKNHKLFKGTQEQEQRIQKRAEVYTARRLREIRFALQQELSKKAQKEPKKEEKEVVYEAAPRDVRQEIPQAKPKAQVIFQKASMDTFAMQQSKSRKRIEQEGVERSRQEKKEAYKAVRNSIETSIENRKKDSARKDAKRAEEKTLEQNDDNNMPPPRKTQGEGSDLVT